MTNQRIEDIAEKLRPIVERLRGEKVTDEELYGIALKVSVAGGNLVRQRVAAAMKERFNKPPNLIPQKR